MAKVINFPGGGVEAASIEPVVNEYGEGSFFALRCAYILSTMESKVRVVRGEKLLKLNDFLDSMVEIAQIFPNQEIKISEIMTFEVINKDSAESAMNIWLENKLGILGHRGEGRAIPYSKFVEQRAVRAEFGRIFSRILDLPLLNLHSYFAYARTIEDDSVMLGQILELCMVDFNRFLASFNKYLQGIEFLHEDTEKLNTLRKAVTDKVKACLGQKETSR